MRTQLLFPPLATLPVVWLAVIGQVRLVFHVQDGWCIEVGGHATVLSKADDTMPLLPLLEVDRVQFYEHLHNVGKNSIEFAGIVQSFPGVLLLKFALESSVSDYWPMKAMGWLEVSGRIAPDIRESLRVMLSKSWATQRLRHRVEAIIKRKAVG
ncbi:hypothetical protein [Ralstonia solanacearum]|uniref:hypothetical protein n=1 Tax=Ralstonia solanacearum TaxID=305 RepID=UPI000F607517|nr:hypothetical protein [Ralstonia solanacearum]MCL9845573.1 hypothetical protein [Ralstonia solanacearum]MDC6255306.1 hypothetical protein [Ralstonia solanacearum]MDC6259485.1 hypothetical protein [Ralstonia solanacearum]MDC6303826.1 hypothetical protein [Ralstonia solanacearum]